MKRGTLFIISGPSGVGKTTLVDALLRDPLFSTKLHKVVTYTTRPKRDHEVDGVDYNFISKNEFKEKIKEHFFLEFSTWYDYYYGTPAYIVKSLEKGTSHIMVVDRMGARELSRLYSKTITLWLQAPSIEVLRNRLQIRGTEDEATIISRLDKAICEQQEEESQNLYKYHIIHDDFDKTLQSVKMIIEKETT